MYLLGTSIIRNKIQPPFLCGGSNQAESSNQAETGRNTAVDVDEQPQQRLVAGSTTFKILNQVSNEQVSKGACACNWIAVEGARCQHEYRQPDLCWTAAYSLR